MSNIKQAISELESIAAEFALQRKLSEEMHEFERGKSSPVTAAEILLSIGPAATNTNTFETLDIAFKNFTTWTNAEIFLCLIAISEDQPNKLLVGEETTKLGKQPNKEGSNISPILPSLVHSFFVSWAAAAAAAKYFWIALQQWKWWWCWRVEHGNVHRIYSSTRVPTGSHIKRNEWLVCRAYPVWPSMLPSFPSC